MFAADYNNTVITEIRRVMYKTIDSYMLIVD